MLLAWFLAGFHSLPTLPISKLGPSGADSQAGVFVYVLGPYGSLQQTLLLGWQLLLPLQPPQVFIAKGFEAFISHAGPLCCTICLALQLFLRVYPQANVGPSSPPATNSSLILSTTAALL